MANTYRMIHIVLALYKDLYDIIHIIATDNHLERICLEKTSEYSAVSDVLSDEFSTF